MAHPAPPLGKQLWHLELTSCWSGSLAEHQASGRGILGRDGLSSGGQKPEVLMFSGSHALRAPDGKDMDIRIPCRCYDSFFSRTREYSPLCFEDGMIKLVASEHSLPSHTCVLMSCAQSQLPDLAAATGNDAKGSCVRPPPEVCPWVTAAVSPRGVRE